MKSQIKNIEQNKFINPKLYENYSGIWVLGEGVLFDTEKQAYDYYGNKSSNNEINPMLFVFNIYGKKYFVIRNTNVFD